MGVFDNIKKWFVNPKQEATVAPKGVDGHFDFRNWQTGIYGGPEDSLETNEEIFGVITRLANTLSSLPVHLYHNYQENDDNVASLVRMQPNPSQSAFDLLNQLEVSRNTSGNGYALIERDERTGAPVHLWPIEPSCVTVKRNIDDNTIWYDISSVNPEFHVLVFNTEIIHVKHISPLTSIVGISPLRVLQGPLRFEKAIEDFSLSEMDKKDQYIIKYDRSIDPKKRKAMINDFVRMIKENGGAVVQEKGFEYDRFESKFQPSDLKTAEQITRARIANAFNVPVSFLNETNGNTVISEQSMIQFVQMTLLPIVRQYETEFNRKLLTPKQQANNYYFKFNVNGLMRGDTASRTDYYQMMIRNGIATQNEVRELEDLPPIKSDAANTTWVSKDLYPSDNQFKAADQLTKESDKPDDNPTKGGEPDNDSSENDENAEVSDDQPRNRQSTRRNVHQR